MIGGLGICGRPFCCSQFLDSFLPVSIKMAKTQNLSLNPTKISGTCGRLMCCLKYEQNAYEDAQKRMPKNESFVQTPDGPGNVKSVDLLQEKVRVALDSAAPSEPLKTYHNCEICVLRNGKGSREGIEIPDERPERYVPEKKEERPFGMPFGLTPLTPLEDDGGGWDDIEAPSREKIGDGKRRRSRRRGGRGNAPRPAQEKPGKPAGDKPAKADPPKDKPPKAEGGQPKSGGNRRGRGRGPRPEGTPKDGAQTRENPNRPPRPPKDAAPQGGPAPKGEKAEGGEAQRRRRSHHRGSRRRKGGEGGAPSAPSSES